MTANKEDMVTSREATARKRDTVDNSPDKSSADTSSRDKVNRITILISKVTPAHPVDPKRANAV